MSRLKQAIVHAAPFQRFINTRIGSFLLVHLGRWWPERYRDVMESPDNAFIPRVPDAGKIIDGCQIMHNGLRIARGSYYGYPITRMLRLNRGVHEPQEERAFAEVLKQIPSGATMLELGAYWSFYSMWFYKTVQDARCFLVEPAKTGLELGQRNFALNECRGHFTHAYVGQSSGVEPDGVARICVDDFVAGHSIEFLHVLHSDIQGFELQMLEGASKVFAEKKVGYVFISTHSNELHGRCIDFLRSHGYAILAECDLNETSSVDGLIVARSPDLDQPATLQISKKRAAAPA
jgi:hypothetical protein